MTEEDDSTEPTDERLAREIGQLCKGAVRHPGRALALLDEARRKLDDLYRDLVLVTEGPEGRWAAERSSRLENPELWAAQDLRAQLGWAQSKLACEDTAGAVRAACQRDVRALWAAVTRLEPKNQSERDARQRERLLERCRRAAECARGAKRDGVGLRSAHGPGGTAHALVELESGERWDPEPWAVWGAGSVIVELGTDVPDLRGNLERNRALIERVIRARLLNTGGRGQRPAESVEDAEKTLCLEMGWLAEIESVRRSRRRRRNPPDR